MKYLSLFTVSLLLSVSSFAQTLNFNDGPSLPKATGAVSSATHDNDIYLVSGFTADEQYSTTIYKLDGDSQEWSVFTDESIPKRFASAEVVGDKLYVLNGQSENGEYNPSFEIYNLIDGSVETMQNIFPRKAAGISSYDVKLYVFGGYYSISFYIQHGIPSRWSDESNSSDWVYASIDGN